MEKTSHDISLDKDNLLREKIVLDEQHKTLKEQIIEKQLIMDKTRLEKRELEQGLIKLEFLIKKKNAEIKLADSAFWSARQSGI